MDRLFKAFLFKITRDITFRITLIIGGGMALFITLVYLLIDYGGGLLDANFRYLTGPNMLLSSISPVQNFGIAIPVNLISFICLEFSQGAIRNKIIAGHSKLRIYFSLCLSGLVFTFALLFIYVGLCVGLGSIFGGFDLSKPIMAGLLSMSYVDHIYILETIGICIMVYATIVFFTVFFATLFRSIGPCIPLVIVTMMALYLGSTIVSAMAQILEDDLIVKVSEFLNPLYVMSGGSTTYFKITDTGDMEYYTYFETRSMIATTVSNVVWSGAFLAGGCLIFMRRDVK